MTMTFTCPQCGKALRVSETMIGRKGRCPGCQFVFQMLEAQPVEEPAADEPPPRPRSRSVAARRPAPGGADYEVVEDRPRRPADDEDEPRDEKRPRKRKRKQAGGGRRTALVLTLIGLGVLLLGGAGFGLWWFLSRGKTPEETRYLADSCEQIEVINIERVLASSAYKRLAAEVPRGMGGFGLGMPGMAAEMRYGERVGLTAEELVRVVTGRGRGFEEEVTVLRTKQPITPDAIKAKRNNIALNEVKVGGKYTIYEQAALGRNNASFCVPESNVVLVGYTDTLRKVLERSGGPQFSDSLRRVLGQADFSKDVVVAGGGSGGGGLLGPVGSSSGIEGTLLVVELGNDYRLTGTMFCTDSQVAASAKNKMDQQKQEMEKFAALMPPEVADTIRNMEVTVSGSRVTFKMTQDVDKLIQAAKTLGGPGGKFPR